MSINVSLNVAKDWCLRLIRDARDFYFQPRRYLRRLQEENREEIITKFALYLLIIETLVLGLGSVLSSPTAFGVFTLIGISIFDIIIAIPLIIVITLVLFIVKLPRAPRAAITLVFSTKIFLGYIPFIFFVIFISTENYVFALLKGITYYGVILLLIVGPAFIFLDKVTKRVLSIALTILFVVIMGFLLSSLETAASRDIFQKMNPFYDPIAREFSENFDKYHSILNPDYVKPLKPVFKFLEKENKYDFGGFAKLREEWRVQYDKTYLSIASTLRELEATKLQYNTNKLIFNTYLRDYVLKLDKLENKYNELFMSSPSNESFINLMQEVVDLMKETNESAQTYVDETRNYVSIIVNLKKWHLIDW